MPITALSQEIVQICQVGCPFGLLYNQPRNCVELSFTYPSSPLCNQPRNYIVLTSRLPCWPALHSVIKLPRSDYHLPFCPALKSAQKLRSYVRAHTMSLDCTILTNSSYNPILSSSGKPHRFFYQCLMLPTQFSPQKMCRSQLDDFPSSPLKIFVDWPNSSPTPRLALLSENAQFCLLARFCLATVTVVPDFANIPPSDIYDFFPDNSLEPHILA